MDWIWEPLPSRQQFTREKNQTKPNQTTHSLQEAEVRIMMEYWRQCALWLINCKVLPANHRVTWESAQVFDLAQTLRDGVLLCHLLNNLRPQTINLKEINLRPQMSQVRNDWSQPQSTPQCSATQLRSRAQPDVARSILVYKIIPFLPKDLRGKILL